MRILAIDVGSGTSDVLFWNSDARGENQVHLVLPSATRVVAREIRAATAQGRAVVFRGPLMGGGANFLAMREHLRRGLPFYAEPAAARSFSDDLARLSEMGLTVVDIDQADWLARNQAVAVRSGDVRLDDLLTALRLLGDPDHPDGFALAVQDHGDAPRGVSDRVFRFQKLSEAFAASRRLDSFFYEPRDIPGYFTRMASAASCLGAEMPVLVADTGPAALWGAALVARSTPCLAVNYGNGHTLMSLVRGDELDGLFEHHTSSLSPASMRGYLERFAAGTLLAEEVLADGGHGAIPVSEPLSLDEVEIVVTGPNRELFLEAHPRQTQAALYGDMMLTGCYGLLHGYLRREA